MYQVTDSPDAIDWAELRRRIAGTPYIVPPRYVRKRKPPNRSLESLEKRRARARVRWVEYYQENKEHCHERQKAWEQANPDKVKAKKHRYYEKHKQDPEWLEAKRARQRAYKLRKKLERQGSAIIEVQFNNQQKEAV